ncbi:MAG: transcriptional regulator, HxlR family [Microbacteriaceae bacterium]|nr:transcriptional regulator, HxlR family [Microbacteriaceae bacterium]
MVGEKWTFLVIRDAFRGLERFSEFRDSLGVSTDILSDRLATLVDHGIMERRSYRDDGSRERHSYHLTERGRELRLVLVALGEWGDRHFPTEFGPVTLYRDNETDERVTVAFVSDRAAIVPLDRVQAMDGPGAS